MEIKVDTHRDSKGDIRRLAQFLLSLEGSGGIRTNTDSGMSSRIERKITRNRNIFDDPSPSSMALGTTPEQEQPSTNAFAGMFGDNATPVTNNMDSSLSNFKVESLFDKEKEEPQEPEKTPQVVSY